MSLFIAVLFFWHCFPFTRLISIIIMLCCVVLDVNENAIMLRKEAFLALYLMSLLTFDFIYTSTQIINVYALNGVGAQQTNGQTHTMRSFAIEYFKSIFQRSSHWSAPLRFIHFYLPFLFIHWKLSSYITWIVTKKKPTKRTKRRKENVPKNLDEIFA